MFFHEKVGGFVVYYSFMGIKNDPNSFRVSMSINPFNSMSGGVELNLTLFSNGRTFEHLDCQGNKPLSVNSEIHYSSEPKKAHVETMREAYCTLENLGKRVKMRLEVLLEDREKSDAVIRAMKAQDHVAVCLLMSLRDMTAAGLEGKSCDAWLREIVSHPAFNPYLIGFIQWDRASTIQDPALQMCTNFAGYLIRSDHLRGEPSRRSKLEEDFGRLFKLAGKTFESRSLKIKTPFSSPVTPDDELPWK